MKTQKKNRARRVETLAMAACAAACLSMMVGCKKRRHVELEETATAAADTGEPGVFDDRIVLASTSVFTGNNSAWGSETWRGSAAYFGEVNANGGVFGRTIEVTTQDDGYDTTRAMNNLRDLEAKNDFFVLYNFVGSNIMIETVAELGKHRDKSLYQFGSIASTSAYRSGPNSDLAFSVRAPIAAEMKQAVDQFVKSGKKKIAVFHQSDAYGRAGLDGVTAALAAHGLTPVAVTEHGVFQKFEDSVMTQVDKMRNAGAEVVFDIGNYNAAAALVRDARESKWLVPIVNNASINDAFVRTLRGYEQKKGSKIAFNVLGVKVVPSPDELSYPLIREYRQLIDRRNPKPPFENFRIDQYSFQSVEGFLHAKIMTEVLRRMGPKPTRAKFRETVESLSNFDVGLNEAQVTYGSDDHTALDKVWLYTLQNGKWIAYDDTRTLAANDDDAVRRAAKVARDQAQAKLVAAQAAVAAAEREMTKLGSDRDVRSGSDQAKIATSPAR